MVSYIFIFTIDINLIQFNKQIPQNMFFKVFVCEKKVLIFQTKNYITNKKSSIIYLYRTIKRFPIIKTIAKCWK